MCRAVGNSLPLDDIRGALMPDKIYTVIISLQQLVCGFEYHYYTIGVIGLKETTERS